MRDEENPYRSPACDDHQVEEVRLRNGQAIQGRLVSRGFAYRRIQLTGSVDALVEYNGRGWAYETVLVNHRIAVREWNLDWRPWPWASLIPRLDFEIRSQSSSVPAIIEVRGCIDLKAFRLSVGDVLVYSEGVW